jgi:DNA-binding NarL/FixJ family response regulator
MPGRTELHRVHLICAEPVQSGPARILIADDHEMIRKGIRLTLESRPDWRIVAEAYDGHAAVEQALATQPDAIVLDIAMPGLTGLEAARRIRAKLPNVPILILTVHDTSRIVQQVLQVGANGYLLKSDTGRELVLAIEALLQGKTYFTSHIARMIVEGYLRAQGSGEADPLSSREREILQMIAEGRSTKEVAQALSISVKTAETHRTNLMKKIGARSVADVVRYAVRNGMVEP